MKTFHLSEKNSKARLREIVNNFAREPCCQSYSKWILERKWTGVPFSLPLKSTAFKVNNTNAVN